MDSLNDILKSLKSIFEDEVRLLSLKGIEKSSVLLGLLATIFVISMFGLLILVFATIALAGYLNVLFDNSYLGYLIVSGVYLLIIVVMLLWMTKKRTPLFTNIFVRKLVIFFNISEDEDK